MNDDVDKTPSYDKTPRGVPIGIEILMKKAAIDSAFRERLLSERSAAADGIDLILEPSEKSIIDTIPEKQLESMIRKSFVKDEHYAVFSGKKAALMIAALTTAAVIIGLPQVYRAQAGIRPEDRRQIRQDVGKDKETPGKPDVSKTNIEPNAPDNVK